MFLVARALYAHREGQDIPACLRVWLVEVLKEVVGRKGLRSGRSGLVTRGSGSGPGLHLSAVGMPAKVGWGQRTPGGNQGQVA